MLNNRPFAYSGGFIREMLPPIIKAHCLDFQAGRQCQVPWQFEATWSQPKLHANVPAQLEGIQEKPIYNHEE